MAKRIPVAALESVKTSSTAVDTLTEGTKLVRQIPLTQIEPHPKNPRRDVGDLTELAQSIKEHGIQQPVTLVPHPTEAGYFYALMGHRRIAAAQQAGLDDVPALILEGKTDREQLELMLVENLQRTDLTISEEGAGFQGLLDLGATLAGIAKKVGKGKDTVTKRVKVAKLPEAVLTYVDSRQLTIEDALALLDIEHMYPDLFEQAKSKFEQGAIAIPSLVVESVRQTSRRREQLAEATAKWKELGHRLVVLEMPGHVRGEDWVRVGELGLTREEHAQCPGAIAVSPFMSYVKDLGVDAWGGWFGCDAPEVHHPGLAAKIAEQADAEQAPKPAEVSVQTPLALLREEYISASIDAGKARREWVVDAMTREGMYPPGLLVRAISDITVKFFLSEGEIYILRPGAFENFTLGSFPQTPTAAMGLVLVAFIESLVDDDPVTSSGYWTTHGMAVTYQWLTALENAGYELSSVEQTMRAAAQPFEAALVTETVEATYDVNAKLFEFCHLTGREVPDEIKPAA